MMLVELALVILAVLAVIGFTIGVVTQTRHHRKWRNP